MSAPAALTKNDIIAVTRNVIIIIPFLLETNDIRI
jgi:hypothetical protein